MNLLETILIIILLASFIYCIISNIQAKHYRKKYAAYSYILHFSYNFEKKDFNQTTKELEQKLLKEVPKQSKKIALFEKLKSEEENLCLCYDKYCKTKKEYESLSQCPECSMPNDILREIELYISPDYIINKKRDKYMLSLTKISYLSAFLNLLPVMEDISHFCLLLTIYPLFNLMILSAPKDANGRKKYYLNKGHDFLILVSIVLNIIFSVYIHYHWWTDFDIEIAFTFSIISTIFLVVLKITNCIRFIKSK